DGRALGANNNWTVSSVNDSVTFNGGLLEIRADAATLASSLSNFASKTLSLYYGNGTVMLDRAVGGSGLAQTVTMGTFTFGYQGRTLTVNGRDGYGLILGGPSALNLGLGGYGAYTGTSTLTNSSNGTVTLYGVVQMANNAGVGVMTLGGNGDFIWNGSLASMASRGDYLQQITKSGSGLAILNATTSGGINGTASLSGGVLQLGTLAALNDGVNQFGGISLNGGALNYVGSAGETTTRLINLSAATGNAILLANQGGNTPLNLTGGVSAGVVGNKSLVLGGTSTAANAITTMISEIPGGSTSVFKSDNGLWVYAPVNTGSLLGGASLTNTTVAGQTYSGTLIVASTLGIAVGMAVSGTNVPTSVVTAISGNTLWLSNAAGNTAVAASTQLNFGTLAAFSGALTLTAGTMRLQATSAAVDLLNDTTGNLIFNADSAAPGLGRQNAGGRLEYVAFGGANTENAGSLVATAGLGVVALTSGGTLNFGSLGARTAGAVVDFQPGVGRISFTNINPVNGLLSTLGGAFTYNGLDFAGTLAGGTVASLAGSYAGFVQTGGVATTNYSLTLSGGSSSTSGQIFNALKLMGSGTLALGGTLGLASGGLIFDNSTGPATISGSTLGAAGAELIVTVNGSVPGNALTISSTIGAGAASLTKSGTGLLVIAGSSTYTGNTVIDAGTLRLNGTSANLGAPSGASFAIVRQGALLDLSGAGPSGTLYAGNANSFALAQLGALTGSGSVDSVSSTNTALFLGGTSTGVFTGIIQNSSSGSLTLVRNGASGYQYLTGLNTYTGATILAGSGILSINSIANGSFASAIGMSSSAASNLVFNGGTLQYTGSNASFVQFYQTPSVATDRLFTMAGNATIDSSGQYGNNNLGAGVANNAALVFSNTGSVVFAGTAGNRLLTLQGNSTGDNEIALQLGNNTVGAGGTLSVTKSGAGQWLLTGTNTYTGTTTISSGVLQARDGIGLPSASNLSLSGGVFQTTDTVFNRPLGTGAGQVQWTASGGGFASAGSSRLVVNIGSLGGALTMASGSFNTSTLILNSTQAVSDVEFQNALNLGTSAGRTIQVDDNTTTGLDFATVSGVISGGTLLTSLTKTGAGNLILSGANTYSGSTFVSAGALTVFSIGAFGATSTSVGTNVSGGSLLIGSGGTTGNLLYVGPGEVTTRTVSLNGTTGGATIDSSGSGPLVLNSVVNSGAGSKTLTLTGLNTDSNAITSALADNGGALNVTKNDGGVWVLNPSLPNTFTGAIAINRGLLGLSQNGLGSAGSITMTSATGNAGIFAVGGPLTVTKSLTIQATQSGQNYTASPISEVFTGAYSMTFSGGLFGPNTTQTYTYNVFNSLENGALLSFGSFTALQTDPTNYTNTLALRGTGNTVFTGSIGSAGTKVAVDISVANSAYVRLDAVSTYAGATNLYQGMLLLNNSTVVPGVSSVIGSGTSGNTLNLAGGELRSTSDITLFNPVSLGSTEASIISGNSNITLAGTITNGTANRIIQNDISGASLTFSGSLNATATTVLQGSGNTVISGSWSNTGGLTYQGTGTLSLTGTNSSTGALLVNRGLVVMSGLSGGTANGVSGVTLNAGGTLRMDDTGGINPAGRLKQTATVTAAGGVLEVIGDGSNVTLGNFTLNAAPGILKMSGTALNSNTLTFASIAMTSPSSILDLSGVAGLGSSNMVKLTNTSGLTFSNGSLVAKVSLGNDFAIYDPSTGFNVFSAYNNVTALDLLSPTDTGSLSAGVTAALTANRSVNGLKLSAATADATGLALTLSGGALLAVEGDSTLNTYQLNSGATLVAQVAAGSSLSINGAVVNSLGLTKVQGGLLSLNSRSFVSSTTNVQGGALSLNGGLNTLQPGQALTVGPGATLALNGNSQFVGAFSSYGILPNQGGVVTSSNGATFVTGAGGTFAGVIDGGINYGMVGATATTLESAQTYTGVTVRSGGALNLENDASLLNTTGIELNTATLALNNNSSLFVQNNNRISDTAGITLRSGAITLNGRAKMAATERMGDVVSSLGANAFTVTPNTGTTGMYASAELTLSSLTRNFGSTVNFSGTSLGLQGNAGRLFLVQSPTLAAVGLLGAWAIGNSTDYAAYNSYNGVGAVGQGGYLGYDASFGSGKLTNLVTTGSSYALSAGTNTIVSGGTVAAMLRIGGAFQNDLAFTNAGDVLNLELGGLLRSNDAASTTIGSVSVPGTLTAGGTLASGTQELVIYNAQSTVTVNSFESCL
ncbi:MAG: hypothetical protein EBS01_02035, partial [Verrucomicrobia bacterium]|nr:hypothetical protein [Verrucomicrobiota bacterium]